VREICYQVASSLDGYIAGPEGEIDWIVGDPEIDFGELFARFDTLLMGRRTWEELPGGSEGLPDRQIIVVSRTLEPEEHPDITVWAGDLEDRIRDLRSRPGKDIWLFGGGELFGSLLRLGVVDSVEIAVIPVLLGDGRPLLSPSAPRVELSLVGTRSYEESGIVSLRYRV
jgi:dihydrofolate reductase